MQVLLALASLTRVVEWWEAENKFWNFSDEVEEGETKDGDEELVFVFKPETEDAEKSKPFQRRRSNRAKPPRSLTVRDEYRSRFSPAKPSTLSGRRSRDEQQKDISSTVGPEDVINQLSKVQTTETLRESADFARYTTIVLELASDGDHVASVNQAWRTIVGYVKITFLARFVYQKHFPTAPILMI